MTDKKPPPWTKKGPALLGTMSDPVLARRLGRTRASVQLTRHRRGIAGTDGRASLQAGGPLAWRRFG